MITIIKSDAIFTSTAKIPFKGHIVVEGNVIRSVICGDLDTSKYRDSKIIDLGNRLVMPGFSDSHTHTLIGAILNSKYCCMDIYDSTSEYECIQMISDYYKKHPDLDIIRGCGWFPAKWGDKLPSKKSLDIAFPDIPVILQSADGHSHWLNTKALELCGITKDTQVSIGSIGKDADGELNGLLFEIEACQISNMKILSLPEHLRMEVYSDFFNEMISYGITSGSDFAFTPFIFENLSLYETIHKMELSGQLKVRLNLYPSLGTNINLDTAKLLRDKYNSSKYMVCGLKTFFDGVTSTYTAALKEPYSDNISTRGNLNYPEEIYRKCIINANKEGFSVRIHALGDYAVSTALNIFDETKKINENYYKLNNCLEHIENIDPVDFERMSDDNITASLQPLHLILDDNEKISRIGKERCKYAFPLKSFFGHGVNVALGTDMPVVSLNPFENIYAALTRCDFNGNPSGCNPEEKIDLATALTAYTAGSAKSHSRDHELGTLENGKLADIIALNCNPFNMPVEKIKDAHTVFVMVDGEIVLNRAN